jgi:hypothetical protein
MLQKRKLQAQPPALASCPLYSPPPHGTVFLQTVHRFHIEVSRSSLVEHETVEIGCFLRRHHIQLFACLPHQRGHHVHVPTESARMSDRISSASLSYPSQGRFHDQRRPSYPLSVNSIPFVISITSWNSQPTSRSVSLADTMAVRTLVRTLRSPSHAAAADFLLDLDFFLLRTNRARGALYSSYSLSACSCPTSCSKDAESGHTLTSMRLCPSLGPLCQVSAPLAPDSESDLASSEDAV